MDMWRHRAPIRAALKAYFRGDDGPLLELRDLVTDVCQRCGKRHQPKRLGTKYCAKCRPIVAKARRPGA